MIDLLVQILMLVVGSMLGAAMVFFVKDEIDKKFLRALVGFAAGIMMSASFWGLLLPAVEQATEEGRGRLAFVPAVVGFLLGMGFLFVLDKIIPHIHSHSEQGPDAYEIEGGTLKMQSSLSKSFMMFLAIMLHNLPEGMAVGIMAANGLEQGTDAAVKGAFVLALAIAIHNFPEGMIVSVPFRANGMSSLKSFGLGALTSLAEPLGALITILAASMMLPLMPYLLSFAAGAMIYVVVEELVPEMSGGEHSNIGTIAFALGFVTMIMLDIGLA